MNYGDSWRNFRGENWRDPQQHLSAPNLGYAYSPFEERSLNYGPQRGYNPYARQQEHYHPAARYAHHRPSAPYLMPSAFYRPHVEEPVFVTPNAGMAENAKVCKSDEHAGSSRKRFEEFEDFSSSDESITIDVKCSTTVCTVNWSLSAKFSSVRYHLLIEVYANDKVVEKIKKDLRTNSHQVQTRPGIEYDVEIRLVGNTDNKTRLIQTKRFKAIFSKSEIDELYSMSVDFAKREPTQQFKYLYRVKPQIYFDDIFTNHNSVMIKYVKDENGHSASPINGEIRGLFFSGHLINGDFPSKSPFGDKRFAIDAGILLSPETVNIYFADFYCTKNPHYVTIVVCKKGSSTDNFCKTHIKKLNFYDNPYLKVEACGGNGVNYNYFVNENVHVEICYTEDVNLSLGYFSTAFPLGVGSSRVGGLRNNVVCKKCNLKKEYDPLKNVMDKPTTPSISEKGTSPELPRSQSHDGSKSKRRSTSNSVDETNEKRVKLDKLKDNSKPSSRSKSSDNVESSSKDHSKSSDSVNVEPSCKDHSKSSDNVESSSKDHSDISHVFKKQTPLKKLVDKDRKERNYAEPDKEVAIVLNALVEKVGLEVDFDKFQKKIESGILDVALLNQNFWEDLF